MRQDLIDSNAKTAEWEHEYRKEWKEVCALLKKYPKTIKRIRIVSKG